MRELYRKNKDLESHILDKIKLIAAQLEDVQWRKISRTCNGVAHSLVRAPIPLPEPVFWKEVGPPWL